MFTQIPMSLKKSINCPHNYGGHIEKMVETYWDQKAKKADHKYFLYSVMTKTNANDKDLGILMLGMANNGNCSTRRSQIP